MEQPYSQLSQQRHVFMEVMTHLQSRHSVQGNLEGRETFTECLHPRAG